MCFVSWNPVLPNENVHLHSGEFIPDFSVWIIMNFLFLPTNKLLVLLQHFENNNMIHVESNMQKKSQKTIYHIFSAWKQNEIISLKFSRGIPQSLPWSMTDE